ncbi:hypothetical protein ARALYDRAFT_487526 [Arabidopsis lyrata subsp. lyrata]|uniref:STL11/RBM22-like N-terminal domain-containing protein n=1 Tax=Arabidopsis lyrata subsp. lyrata TaxID=81972 RepID=D7LZX0_ARALL|nr:hypothetical protein ARALYDRAFT_487526 [Arabidopsis lyrata subsp. lyrata]
MAHRDHGADFPITCESCFGDNPYVRMTRADYDKECKICRRPFTAFRWRPGRNARFKKTEICQTCCRLKNVCQVCLLDLEFGLPVQVRDTALQINSTHYSIPESHVNREYFAEDHDRKTGAGLDYESSFGKMLPNVLFQIFKEQHHTMIGTGHEFVVSTPLMPETGELSQQNIKDRYYGVNDPVAKKLHGKAGEMGTLEPPEDESIKTLYVRGLNSSILEQDIHDKLYAYGAIRVFAEKGYASPNLIKVVQTNSNRAVWLIVQQYYTHPPPPNQYRPYDPSMDPQRMGAVISTQEGGGSSTSENNGASSSYPMPPHQPNLPPPYGYMT